MASWTESFVNWISSPGDPQLRRRTRERSGNGGVEPAVWPAAIAPPRYHKAITPGASVLSPLPQAVYVKVAGTASLSDAADTSIEYDLPVGLLPFVPTKVTAAAATLIGWYDEDPG